MPILNFICFELDYPSTLKMAKTDKRITNVLFLLRSYNDIDHIAPIIWKCSKNKLQCYYFLVELDHSMDYRIKFIEGNGAVRVQSRLINFYHHYIRNLLVIGYFKRVFDVLIGYTVGKSLLDAKQIDVVVTEWSGRSGRGKAKYLLRPAFKNDLRVYSVPHGFNIYTNVDVSRTIVNYKKRSGSWPDFSSRNVFTRYVVQHSATQRFCETFGIQPDKLVVLGSARFCREWVNINDQISEPVLQDQFDRDLCKIVFFLPQWDYNVDRENCYRLILLLSNIPGVFIRLKGSTREIEALYDIEERDLKGIKNIVFSNIESSTSLIKWSNVVVNFASSIGLEAVMQNKFILNPSYLHSNTTIFDSSSVAIDCDSSDSVQDNLLKLKKNLMEIGHKQDQQAFYEEFIQGGGSDSDVLGKYLKLILGHTDSG